MSVAEPDEPHRSYDSDVVNVFPADADEPLPCARAIVRAKYIEAGKIALQFWQENFLRWSAGAWRPIPVSEISATIYTVLDEAGEKPTRSKVVNIVDAMKAAVYLNSNITPPCLLDSDRDVRHLLALRNGVLDLTTSTLYQPTPTFFTLSALPVSYDADSGEPVEWLRFLASIWPDDSESIATLQELAGYLLTPDTDQQKIFLMVGPKRSGKGTILRTLAAMLGTENVCAPTLSSLAGNFGLQGLIGKLAAFIGDARLGGRVDQAVITERLLSISGQDNMAVARKFLPDYTARLDTRFVLSTNELPRLTDASGALASRFVLLVLAQSFYGREDIKLEMRLRTELPAILLWAIEGRRRLLARGHFEQPVSSRAALEQLADLGSPIGAFVRAECTVAPGLSVGTDRLFDVWKDWCTQQGRDHPGTKAVFGRDLAAACPGIRVAQRRDGDYRYRVYEGLGLQDGTG